MTRVKLVFRSLGHYWRAHLGVLLGTAIATAVLVGALAVGDSVRYTLRKIALDRLGDAAAAVAPQGRFFRSELGDVLGEQVDAPTAAVIQVEGLLRSGPTGARSSGVQASGVQVYGVDETFWKLAPAGGPPAADWADGIVLNPQLAETLDAEVGDELNLYVAKPSALPRDAPLARDDDLVESIANLKVTAIASVEQFGRFSLRANQVAPQVAFLPRDVLAGPIEQQGLANLLLIGGPDTQDRDAAAARAEQAAKALADSWQLEDVALQLHPLDERRFSVRTSRVFLDTPLVDAALEVDGNAYPVLTYFVNALAAGDKATPYSMVAAMNPPARPIPGKPATAKQTLQTGMKDDQIVITQWLADDLGIGVRDTLTLRYYVVGPRRTLTEASRDFQVVKVVGMDSPAIDRTLMPDFPGLDAANCRDWEPGIPIDTRKIRDKDEDYWDTYRGTPKAFVTLAAGREMWANRYGETTEVRFPAGYTEDELAAKIRSQIDPSVVGLAVLPVRADALDAASESLDFGQLFIGFSFFLIVAAVLLAALLFVFGVQQRTSQVGTLLALGYKPAQVRRLLTGEGLIVAVAGAVIGAPLGLLYTRGMLWGLATAWSDAVPSSQIAFHAAPTTVAIGAAASVVVAVFAMWLTLIRLSRRPVRQLQAAGKTGRIDSPL
ncbi:MAG: FtsX-like permease family protein, partial [Planctomycetota bacterium]